MASSNAGATRFIAALQNNLTAEHFSALEACLNCRHCGSACAWHLATDETELHPKYKTDFLRLIYQRHIRPLGRWLTRLGIFPPLTDEVLLEHMPSFWKCTTCGRCTLACPLSLSNRSLVRLARGAYAESGLIAANPVLNEIFTGSRDQRHSFAMPRDQVHVRLGLFSTQANVQIPFDVPGAEYLYTCAAVGNARFPDYGLDVPQLLNAAGVRYTFSSRITDTGTDIEYVLAQQSLSQTMLLEVEAEALRLGVKTLLISECGCDTKTFYQDAGDILGRPLRVAVQSLDSLLLQLVRSQALPVVKLTGTVTFHDSCKITRLAGMGELARELLQEVSQTFSEMTPNRERNYCCNGGTGPLRLPENTPLRRKISKIKADQIKATGAQRVVTPCSVCMLSLEDTAQTYALTPPGQRMSFLLFELVYEAVHLALQARQETARMQVPAVFQEQTNAFIHNHSMTGRLTDIFSTPAFPAYLTWLRNDPVVNRYAKTHPAVWPLLDKWTQAANTLPGALA